MTPTHQRTTTKRCRTTGLLALLVLFVLALSAASAAASTSVGASPLDGAPVVGTTSAPAVAGSSGPSTGSVTISTPSGSSPPAAHTGGQMGRDQPTILAGSSGDAAVGRLPRSQPASQPSRVTVDSSIVGTSNPTVLKPTQAQLASGGPFVAAGGGAVPVVGVRRLVGGVVSGGVASWSRGLPLFGVAAPVARVVSVSVAMEGVYLSGSTSARRPGLRVVVVAGAPVGPAGLGSVSLVSPWGSGSRAPGGVTLLGSAPVSTSGASGVSLVLTAVLAGLTLLAGVSGRRGSWVWPEVGVESLLCSSALDRPG